MIVQDINETNFKEELEKGNTLLEKKFQMVRSFSDLNPLPETKEKFGKLMRDPTKWAYALLKDKQDNPIKLYPFQDIVLNDKNRFVICAAANQMGKTWGAVVKALHHALYVENASVLIVSRSEDQSKNILDEIKWMMRRSDVDFKSVMDEVDNRMELHLKTKYKGISVIRCLPPTPSAAGFYSTLMICDEQGFWETKNMDEIKFFYQVLETRTNMVKNWEHPFLTMGQIFIISNPNGQRGLFWHLWDKDHRFSKHRICWLANPFNTLKEYNEKRNLLAQDVFDSSYASVFSSASGSFITADEFNNAVKEHYELTIPPGVQLFLGGDFAGEDTRSRGVDLHALIGQIRVPSPNNVPKLRMVYYKVFPPRTKKMEVYEDIKVLSQKNVVRFAYDKVGVGDSVKNDLIEKNILTEGQILNLTYSLPNKSEVYWNLKSLFEQGRLEIRDIPQLREQLLGLRFEKTGGGYLSNGIMQSYIKIHHSHEKIHDDIADAFANSCFAAKEGTPDLEYKWIPNKKPIEELPKPKAYSQRVICSKCGGDWDYGGEDSCLYCGAEKLNILDYCYEKPLFNFSL